MKFNTLYSKLAVSLFVVVCLIGLLFFILVRYAIGMYQQEMTQRLNADLATHIVADTALLRDNTINQAQLASLFHNLMVINPSIELYLLDRNGRILGYSAPPGKVQRERVDLAPVAAFLAGNAPYPLRGDDPRDSSARKVFSAAAIHNGETLEGYLYVILEGAGFASIGDLLKGSNIARLTLAGLLAGLVVALLAGLVLFFLTTRRLTGLSATLNAYARQEPGQQAACRYPSRHAAKHGTGDEIDQLGENFNIMADRIDAQLQALQRTDAQRRELVANVSHDLRTPLATLHGYLETLLLKKGLTEAEQRRYLTIALGHSERLGQMVTELFELARLDSCETLVNSEPFSMAELVQDVLQKFRLQARERDIELEQQSLDRLPFAYGDIGLMQRVLENLIDNAMRYTPRGGRVTVSLAAEKRTLVVKVADTGCGIEAEEIPHIFDRFYRIEKCRQSGQGHAGLGLAIVKRILKLHGSDIEARSERRQGTVFSFRLATWQE